MQAQVMQSSTYTPQVYHKKHSARFLKLYSVQPERWLMKKKRSNFVFCWKGETKEDVWILKKKIKIITCYHWGNRFSHSPNLAFSKWVWKVSGKQELCRYLSRHLTACALTCQVLIDLRVFTLRLWKSSYSVHHTLTLMLQIIWIHKQPQ